MPSTLPLDPVTWDLVLDSQNNWSATSEEPTYTNQSVANAVLLFTNDCFLFPEIGVPYKRDVIGQYPSQIIVEAYWKKMAKTVPTVATVLIENYRIIDRTICADLIVYRIDGGVSNVNIE